MNKKYVLAVDEGTTSCRAILFDRQGVPVRTAQREFAQHFPQPGWVEHDAQEIWEKQRLVMREAAAGVDPRDIAAVGITNQRETAVIWDRATGKPLHPAIVWQCRRSAPLCEALKQAGLEEAVRAKTGLVLDSYFSATKIKWILDRHPDIRGKAEKGEALFGTVDSWLIWNLTGGKVHATDYTNASRTLLFNIHTLEWDDELLEWFGVPRAMLPEVKPSGAVYGYTDVFGADRPLPIAGTAGDQQAALFGQGCNAPGMAKNTYGTGCFILLHTGETPVDSRKGLLTTIASGTDGRIQYALEGSVFTGGAVVQWLRDGLGLIASADETEAAALSVSDTGGVYIVPAFTGLGAPYWNPDARGLICGLTRGTDKARLIRAALESIAYQCADVLQLMEQESGTALSELRVDGGAAVNNFLMQFQADLLGVPVVRPQTNESTALGAALLAGLTVGFWDGPEQIRETWRLDRRFAPAMDSADRERLLAGWRRAVGMQTDTQPF